MTFSVVMTNDGNMNIRMLFGMSPVVAVGSFTGFASGLQFRTDLRARADRSKSLPITVRVPSSEGPPVLVTISWNMGLENGAVTVLLDGQPLLQSGVDSGVITQPKLRALLEMLLADIKVFAAGTTNFVYADRAALQRAATAAAATYRAFGNAAAINSAAARL